MYNNSDGRFVLHFKTSTTIQTPYRAHSKLPPFLSRAPQWPPQSFTNNKHSFNLYSIFIFVLLQQPPTTFNMLFNTLTVLGFAALAVAAPALEKKEAIKLPARGVNFVPRRSLRPRGGSSKSHNSWINFGSNFDIQNVITETTVNVLQIDENPLLEAQVQEETLLAQTLTEALIGAQVQFNQALDNIRINTLNQLNNNVNTVAIVVTEISDNRDSSNSNTRYISRQLQSNPSISEQAFVVIEETSSLTLSSSIPSSVLSAAQSSSTGSNFTPQFGSYTPNGNASLQSSSGQFNLYPSGSAFPSFGNAQQLNDPALIVLANQQYFVQSSQNSDVFTSVVEAELTQIEASVVVSS
ncbi:hypothetical protein N431DRAFT_146702 [Stipitochalara longipes BDJ]|nr:hypothetical protein N431DRAFT_146702 [Stipitochalara longipes BDJ]